MGIDAVLPVESICLARCASGELVYEPDVELVPFPFPKRLAAGGLRSLVMVPLLVNGSVIAILLVAQKKVGAFSSTDCEFLKQLGEHVALAVSQTQLYSDLQKAYDELRQSQQSMLSQERLRALGQMAGGIAHDINNAISPAMMYTEFLLERDSNLDAQTRKRLTTIKRAIEDVAHTVARLREFYRRDEGPNAPGPVDLNEALTQVVELTKVRWHDMPQQHGIVIDLKVETKAGIPSVLGIASEIREALINLVFNAIDAMPDGGILTLRTYDGEQGIAVEVADSGTGMDEDTRRRCLEPFFTTKGERGTGIGLAMVYGIVQRHSAEIVIDSIVGKGTSMRLVFPHPRSIPRQAPVTPLAAPVRNLRILVIDDDPRLLETLVEFLEAEGHEVTKAEHGQAGVDAFNAALASDRAHELVITDLGMPHLDGRMVAKSVKSIAPATPVILLTGWGQRLVGDTVPPEVDRILDKPPVLKLLRQAIAELAPSPANQLPRS